jgi:colanic acid/amylovoran biosynthesis glycosyltransferase
LTHLERVRSIVLTSRTENLDTFPYDPIFEYEEFTYRSGTIGGGLRRIFEMFTSRKTNFYVQTCRSQEVDLLHAHFGTEGYYQLPVKRRLEVPQVTTFYGSDISKTPQAPKWRRRYQQLFQEGDLFLAEGSHMAQSAVDLGCPPDKVKELHLGVDLDSIEYVPRVPDESGEVNLLITASFREKKGIPYGIKAFAKAYRRLPNLRLTIIGGAKTEQESQRLQHCQDIVSQEGVGDRVRFLGYVQYPTYLEEQRRAHIFLAPSVTASNGDTEGGAPVSIIEASAAGMPVISTWHCDIPEVVVDEVSGILVPERDVEALTEVILEVATAPERWKQMGKAGRAHVEAEYDVKKQVAKLEQIYLESL